MRQWIFVCFYSGDFSKLQKIFFIKTTKNEFFKKAEKFFLTDYLTIKRKKYANMVNVPLRFRQKQISFFCYFYSLKDCLSMIHFTKKLETENLSCTNLKTSRHKIMKTKLKSHSLMLTSYIDRPFIGDRKRRAFTKTDFL